MGWQLTESALFGGARLYCNLPCIPASVHAEILIHEPHHLDLGAPAGPAFGQPHLVWAAPDPGFSIHPTQSLPIMSQLPGT